MIRLDKLDTPIFTAQVEKLKPDLDNMQGNILRSHGRDRSVHIFLRFTRAKNKEAKKWIADIANGRIPFAQTQIRITSAQKQYEDTERYNNSNGKLSGDLFCCFFLSDHGYDVLEIPKHPPDPVFQQGMEARQQTLNDPPKEEWDREYQDKLDAMLLLAEDVEQNLFWDVQHEKLSREEQLRRWEEVLQLREVAEVCAVEYGRVMRHPRTQQRVGHFGYVDGRSQPVFFVRDMEKESDGTDRWKPKAGPNLVLVEDPNAAPYSESPAYGSYLVYRKLEQNVCGFQEHLNELASTLQLQGHDRQRAQALIMGRYRDGTPVVLQPSPGMSDPVPNNFDFTKDPQGLKCPFQAHIRRMNPRGERDQTVRNTIAAALMRLSLVQKPEERDCMLTDLVAELARFSGGGPEDCDRIRKELDALILRLPQPKPEDRYRIQSEFAYNYGGEFAHNFGERDHRIARRSVPYAVRQQGQYDHWHLDQLPLDQLPEDGVGLLFMCYQSNIRDQFEFLQGDWANNEAVPAKGTGVDALIGRARGGHTATGHTWPLQWNANRKRSTPGFESFVTLKGGEYFFAPSIPFLKNIAQSGAC
jgi:deferrochelatase/peroxidase EfeB